MMNLFLAELVELGYTVFMAAVFSGLLLMAMHQVKMACHNFLASNKA